MTGIYMIKNKINNKYYIGKATNIKVRWKYGHIKELKNNRHKNIHLQSSWNKYSEDNFEFSVIEECIEEMLNNREKYWIAFYKSYDPMYGYNKTKGGDGCIPTEEIKSKISDKLKGRKLSSEHRENIGKASKGRSLSKESRLKLSNSIQGHLISEETREKIRTTLTGHKHTDEAKQKISNANKNRSKETFDKISKANKGKKRSEETKRKMSEAAKNRKPVSEETKSKIAKTLKNKNKA